VIALYPRKMVYGAVGGGDFTGPLGLTYAAVLVRLDGPSGPVARRDEVIDALRRVGFSGWVGPAEGGWLASVAVSGDRPTASGRRGAAALGAWLSADLDVTSVAIQVRADRQLLLVVQQGPDEVGLYLSDPSFRTDPADQILPYPLGPGYASAFAAACGHPASAGELEELLAEHLDPDSFIESERLAGVLRLLDLPRWLVSAARLPKPLSNGPLPADFTRLRAGRTGAAGLLAGWLAGLVRNRRPLPPPVADPPRDTTPDIDPWLM
jgi:hypothetical protein